MLLVLPLQALQAVEAIVAVDNGKDTVWRSPRQPLAQKQLKVAQQTGKSHDDGDHLLRGGVCLLHREASQRVEELVLKVMQQQHSFPLLAGPGGAPYPVDVLGLVRWHTNLQKTCCYKLLHACLGCVPQFVSGLGPVQ